MDFVIFVNTFWVNLHWTKLAKLAIPVSEKDQVCSPVIRAFGGVDG